MVDNLDYPVQLIQPNGARVCRPEFDRLITDIGPDELLSLYRDLVVSRRIDTEAVALQRQGEIGLWAPMLGQEAAQVGSARALAPDDFAFTSYREHAVAYCRGVPPELLTTMWRGISHSGWDPEQFNVTNPAIVVGSQGLHATGYALGAHLDGAEIATIAYFGDGATSQGDIAEAMGFAASFRVGVVFFCQNNQWAISEPVSLQSRTPISHRAIGYGIPAIRVDGNDVLAVLAVTRSALNRAREAAARRSSRRSPAGWARTRPPTIRAGTAPIRICRSGEAAIRSSECVCSSAVAIFSEKTNSAPSRQPPTTSPLDCDAQPSRSPIRPRQRSSITSTPRHTH